jgi:hypothetical protein
MEAFIKKLKPEHLIEGEEGFSEDARRSSRRAA